MSKMRDVSIVIPNWNGEKLLPEFLPTVIAAAHRYRDEHRAQVEVIVSDDASTDASVGWIKENYGGEVRLIERKKNGGVVPTANEGFRAARHPVVLLFNNDVRLEPDAIAPLVRHFDDERVFAVCCKAFRLGTELLDGAGKVGTFTRGFWRVYVNYDILPTRLPKDAPPLTTFYACSGYAAFDREKFFEIGGFCELYAPIYWDDVEISYRAWKRGWTVHYEPRALVHHKSSATMGKPVFRKPMKIITERNRILLVWINLHDPVWMASHLGWLAVKLLGATVSFNIIYWRAFLQALGRLPAALRARREERRSAVRTDREIVEQSDRLIAEPWVEVIRNDEEYRRYVELKRQLEIEAAAAR